MGLTAPLVGEAVKRRNSRRLGWLLVGTYLVLIGTGLALEALTGSTMFGLPVWFHTLAAAACFVWSLVGVLLVSRHPEHPVGWLFLAMPVLIALDHFTYGYAYYGTVFRPGSLPGAQALIFWQYSTGAPVMAVFTFLFLLFPSGKPPTRRWWWVGGASISTVALYVALATFAPERAIPAMQDPFPSNPFGLSEATYALLDTPRRIFYTLLFVMPIIAAFSMFYRLRRSTGIERQQIKWLVYAAAFFAVGAFLEFLYEFTSALETGFDWVGIVANVLVIVSVAGIAIASAIAILRYRLYDIDIIIRRTLVYALLSATLALVYFGSVALMQSLFTAVSGQQSPVIIVISTLLIAALFTPLRGRIQAFIDRRFYRSQYDAAQTLTRFAAVARDEVDLDELKGELLKVVQETVQPAVLSLWLKE